ncbi:MAG: SDR family oxidoreductase [Flavobacteriales bacterium]|nr:SDR family oxidoreductase [Flavobacteriales bacterium]
MKSFKEKIIWITGASSGIGEELATQLSEAGAKLVLSSRRIEELERVKGLCANPENILNVVLDLSSQSDFKAEVEQVIAHFGQIDCVINNGGVSQRSLIIDTDMATDRRIMETNYFGTVSLVKQILPHMLAKKSGHMVAMSSISGKFGFGLRSAYSASKHALHGFFESLRFETWKENIKVTIVCPGKIKTSISINALDGTGNKHNKMDDNQNEGMLAKDCAKEIIQAIRKDKEEVYIGGAEITAVYVKRFFPRLFSKLIRKAKTE